MMKNLDKTRDQIAACTEGVAYVEQMKLFITPDAATLISQGDTLIFEAHGKSNALTKRLMAIQATLRDKFKEVQHTRPVYLDALDKSQSASNPENQTRPKEKYCADKKFPTDLITLKTVNLEEMAPKVLKRVNDLINKPLNLESESELHYRLIEIKVSRTHYTFPVRSSLCSAHYTI